MTINTIDNIQINSNLTERESLFRQNIESFLKEKYDFSNPNMRSTIRGAIRAFGENIGWKPDYSSRDISNWLKSEKIKKLSLITQQTYKSYLCIFSRWTGKDISSLYKSYIYKYDSNNKFMVLVRKYAKADPSLNKKEKIRRLYKFGAFINWNTNFDKNDVINFITSNHFKNLSSEYQSQYCYLLKNFLKWLKKDFIYISEYIKNNKDRENMKQFIKEFCEIRKSNQISKGKLLNALNQYLYSKNLPPTTSKKLVIFLKLLGTHMTKTNLIGIDLSYKGEEQYGDILSYEFKKEKKKKEQKYTIDHLSSCIAGNLNPALLYLYQIKESPETNIINLIKENYEMLKKILTGICKYMTKKCINRRPEVIVGATLYMGIDELSQEEASQLTNIDSSVVRIFLKQLLGNKGLSKRNKEQGCQYFLNI